MSTGLTWVSVIDHDNQSPDGYSWIQVFSDYDEAIAFAIWEAKLIWNEFNDQRGIKFMVYTSSPNPNGYINAASDPAFVPYD